MGVGAPATDTFSRHSPNTRSIVELVIVIFLLFFAVLAFAWFYLQRAKARTAPVTDDVAAATASASSSAADASVPAAAPAEPVAPVEADTTRTDQPAS